MLQNLNFKDTNERTVEEMDAEFNINFEVADLGGFQLLDLIITELKSHNLLKIQGLSLVEILYVKKNPLQDLPSSLHAVIPPNERH